MRANISSRPVAATEAVRRSSVDGAGGTNSPEMQRIYSRIEEVFRPGVPCQTGAEMFLGSGKDPWLNRQTLLNLS